MPLSIESPETGRQRGPGEDDSMVSSGQSGMRGMEMIDWRTLLTSDPEVCGGQICARGTRVLVTNILDSLAEGATRDEILRSYPSLKPEHIDAALVYAAELAREESLLPLRSS
jgi:uncharacterized protein (DUF433 family)